jgi:hypothetical protein
MFIITFCQRRRKTMPVSGGVHMWWLSVSSYQRSSGLLHHHLYQRYKHLLSTHKWDIACGCPNLNLILYQRLLHPLSSDLAGTWRIEWPDEDYAMWQTDTPQNSYGVCPWTYWGLKSWQLAMWWGWRCEAARTCFDDTKYTQYQSKTWVVSRRE